MSWLIFFLSSLLTTILLVPQKKFKVLWPAGLITMTAIYTIDTTLVSLGAFLYKFPILFVSGLPIFYLLSGFFGGMLLVHFFPSRTWIQLPYILLAAFLFLCLELIMSWVGYFEYGQNWNPVRSFFLNTLGFTIVLSLYYWIMAVSKRV